MQSQIAALFTFCEGRSKVDEAMSEIKPPPKSSREHVDS